MLRELWVHLRCPPWLITICQVSLDLILFLLLLSKAVIISGLSEIIKVIVVQYHRLYMHSTRLEKYGILLNIIGFRGAKLDLIIFLKLLLDFNVTSCWLFWFCDCTVVLLVDTEEVTDLKVDLTRSKRVVNGVQTLER
jgi:hypothetical protein